MQRLLLGLMRLCVPVQPLLPGRRPAHPSFSRSSSAFIGAHKHLSRSQLPLQRGYAAQPAIKEAELGDLQYISLKPLYTLLVALPLQRGYAAQVAIKEAEIGDLHYIVLKPQYTWPVACK